jgi:hypothetical protein
VNIKTFNKRLELLRSERSSFISLYQELSDYHMGHRGRFLTSDRNKGFKRNTKSLNNTSLMAARTLGAGMVAGITSPARPWFQLQSGDVDLNEYSPVKEWLHKVQTLIYRVFAASDVYKSLHNVYSELGVFGTAAIGVFDDFDNVIRNQDYTAGSYFLGVNDSGVVDTFYCEYERTVAQLVKKFGINNVSTAVKQAWDNGNTEVWVRVVHAVEPNDDRDLNSPLAKDKRFRSVYYEANCQQQDKFLLRSGFDLFPFFAPRWDAVAGDIYSPDSPGMVALGDTKTLQLAERRLAQAVDRLASPPLQASSSLKTKIRDGLDADKLVFTDNPTDTISSIYGNYRPEANQIREIIRDKESRIQRAFYEDLFLMLANSDRRQITAREISERHEEKLLMLGPVLERIHGELLDPLIDVVFARCLSAGLVPPPPPELQGRELSVQYVSVLAQAQKMVAIGGLERLTNFALTLGQAYPDARVKFNAAQAIDEYANAMGVNPRIIRGDDEVDEIIDIQNQQAAQAQAMQVAAQAVESAKTLSETNMSDDSTALHNVMKQAGLA